jgi:hypothetical protein
MKIDDTIHGISTLISVATPSGSSQGSGFFYQELEPFDNIKKDRQWRNIDQVWLVTNRHVAFPRIEGNEIIPSTFTFHIRRLEGSKVIWDPIILNHEQLLNRIKLHKRDEVDVCAIQVLDLLKEKIKSDKNPLQWNSVSKDNLPGQNKIHPEVASDAIIVGYPRGYYDKVHLYPIVKSGIIASKWGAPFGGDPYFLIDAKLFPGSSGSIVLTKPTNMVLEDGNIFHNKEKQFAFLGIYSGEPFLEHQPIEFDDVTILRKSGFNLGIVWYSDLVEEIIGSVATSIET